MVGRLVAAALAVALCGLAEASNGLSLSLQADDECAGEACTLSMLQKKVRDAESLQAEEELADLPKIKLPNEAAADHKFKSSDGMEGVPDVPGAPARVAKEADRNASEAIDQMAEKLGKQKNTPEADNVYKTNDGMAGVPDVPGAPAAEIKKAKAEDRTNKQANDQEADHVYKSSDSMEGVPEVPGAPAAAKAESKFKKETRNIKDNTAQADNLFHSNDGMYGVPDVPGAPAQPPALTQEERMEIADDDDAERDLLLTENERMMMDGMDYADDFNDEYMDGMDDDYDDASDADDDYDDDYDAADVYDDDRNDDDAVEFMDDMVEDYGYPEGDDEYAY